jgi:hypothetical protein
MPLIISLIIALGSALLIPLSVRTNPDTFGGMLKGTLWTIPYTYTTLHIAWPVFFGVLVLIWILLKVAR